MPVGKKRENAFVEGDGRMARTIAFRTSAVAEASGGGRTEYAIADVPSASRC